MRAALLLCAALALAMPASAQSMRGVALGEPIPEGLPEPVGTETQHPYAYTLWSLGGGLSMSATTDAETGEVLYLEIWRDAPDVVAPAPVPGLSFGETTRAGVEAMFGSEGLVFSGRGRFAEFGPVAAYFLTYEIADSDAVLSVVTIQPLAEASEATAGAAVLDSVILGQGPYLDQIWGMTRGTLPGYAPIPDPLSID